MLYEYFVSLCFVCASLGREIMFLRFYPGLLRVPGDTVLTTFVLTFLLRTFMAARNHKQLCYVERGCYINRLFVCPLFDPAWDTKLCFICFNNFWYRAPV